MSQPDPRPALWETMVARAEALHDHIVKTQRRPTRAAARRIARIAMEIAVAAQAATLLRQRP